MIRDAGENLWVLYPRPDSFIHKPGGNLKINLTVQNISGSSLYFSKTEIAPSWAKGKRGIKVIEKKEYLPADSSISLVDISLRLPQRAGLHTLKFGLETWMYNYYTTDWEKLGVLWTSGWGYIQVTPQPVYIAFVSRSNRREDAPVVEQILNMIRVWGFNCKTIGIDVFSEDPLRIPSNIRGEIENADAVIATPRDYSLQEKVYKTFSWLHHYSLKEEKEIMEFIMDHSFLDILLEAPKQIFRIFGRNVRLRIELNKDPEEPHEEIFVIIETKAKNALERLEKFDKEWFDKFEAVINSALNFMVERL